MGEAAGPDDSQPRPVATFDLAAVGSRGQRPVLLPATVLAVAFLGVTASGWIGRLTSEPPTPASVVAPERSAPAAASATPTATPMTTVAPARAADSPVLGRANPEREHGTDGLLGGIVFRRDG